MAQECFGNASDSLITLLFAESYQDPALTKGGGKKLAEMKYHTEMVYNNVPAMYFCHFSCFSKL